MHAWKLASKLAAVRSAASSVITATSILSAKDVADLLTERAFPAVNAAAPVAVMSALDANTFVRLTLFSVEIAHRINAVACAIMSQ